MHRLALLFAAPAMLFAADVAAQAEAAAVTGKLKAAGYAEVREVEYDGGLWEAEVRRADGSWGEVAVDATTNEIFDAKSGRALLDLAAVTQVLAKAGYTDITDLERDGALWDAEARDAKGQPVELRISGYDGRIVDSDVDYEHDDDESDD